MPKLLLVKLGAIGDVVMAIPAAALMHQAGFEVHWVVGEMMAPVLRLYPWIHVLAVNERSLLRESKRAALRALLPLWRELRRRGPFDQCVTLYYDGRYRLLTLPVRANRKVLLSRTERALKLLPGRHHTDEYARILTGRLDGETPSQLSPVSIQSLPAPEIAPNPSRPRVVLVPGGARNLLRDDALRRWPVERYVELAGLLLQREFEVVLLGGPGDTWVAPHFSSLDVLDLTGKLSLLESLALLQSAEVTVTHDTGPMHMAGITPTSIVALFGPTSPYNFCPRRPNVIALWGGEGFACRPCYDGRHFAPCPHNGCMHQITVAMALNAVERLLLAASEGRIEPARVELPAPAPVVSIKGLSGCLQ